MCFPDLPRLVAPLSTSRVTSRRPRLRWTLEGGAAPVTVRLCRDRAMIMGCTTFASSTPEGAPPSDLAPGVWFWQVERPLGMATGISMTWQFVVGARTAARNTSWGTVPDFNGDGIGDLAVGTTYQAPLRVYYGRRTGFLEFASFQTSSGQVPTASVASAGDVDGDGFADLVTGEGAYAPLALFYGAATGLSTSTGRLERLNSTVPGGFTGLGYSVSSAGDVNGDGFADIVAGEVYAGNALVFFGSAAGIRSSPTVIPGPSGGCGRFGWSVAGADVNGDGFSDVLVGDPCVPDSLLTPRFHVYLGSVLGISTSPVLSVRGRSGAQFGWSVVEAGDLNGDGYTDIAVGAPGEVTPGPQLFVYQGGPAGFSTTATVTLTRSDTNFFGAAVRGAGDVTGDGYPDLLVGNAFGGTRVHLYAGSASGPATPPLASLTGDSSFGTGVTGLGDLNGDGFEDVAVGTPGVGREYVTVYLGASMGFGVTLSTIYGPRDGSEYGRTIALARRRRSPG